VAGINKTCTNIIAAIMYFFGGASIYTVVAFTILFNVVLFFISPWIQDWLMRWLYKAKFYTVEDFRKVAPEISEIIESVSSEYRTAPHDQGQGSRFPRGYSNT